MRRLVLSLVMLALLAGPASARGEWYDHYEDALIAVERGDHAAAVELLQAALERKPRSGYLRTYGNNYLHYVPHYQMGVARHGAGDCVAALASFGTSSAAGETTEEPALAANLDLLRAECEERLAPPPVEPQPRIEPFQPTPAPLPPPIDRRRLERGIVAYLAGQFETSGAAFDQLAAEHPASARLRLLAGMAYHGAWVSTGESDDDLIGRARAALAEAARIDPGLTPDPALCPPRVVALFRSLR